LGRTIIILCSGDWQEDHTTAPLWHSFNNSIPNEITAINRNNYYVRGRVLFSLICELEVSNVRANK
jgi:hypothetical protein